MWKPSKKENEEKIFNVKIPTYVRKIFKNFFDVDIRVYKDRKADKHFYCEMTYTSLTKKKRCVLFGTDTQYQPKILFPGDIIRRREISYGSTPEQAISSCARIISECDEWDEPLDAFNETMTIPDFDSFEELKLKLMLKNGSF
jgi:hypothetical protein